jgi:hypothetical protein
MKEIFDDKLMQNEQEVLNINTELHIQAEFILNKYGPEGAYEMAKLLYKMADNDIEISNKTIIE